jgi:hypothetical protein
MARFTTANAREMAAKGNAAKAERLKRLRDAAFPPANLPLECARDAGEGFLARRLFRVRAQLDMIDERLLSERDPHKLERLAACSYRLAEQERILAGRPTPGARRPQEGQPSRTWMRDHSRELEEDAEAERKTRAELRETSRDVNVG